MADLATILTGLKTATETISGLHGYAGWPDSFQPPGVIWMPHGRRAGSLNRAVQTMEFRGTVAVLPGTLRTAQAKLFDHLDDSGANSVEAALLADETLGGAVSGILDIEIESGDAWGTVQIGGQSYAAGVIRVEVICG